MVDATQLSLCQYTCTHGWCYATVLCQYTCTHGWCYATVLCQYTHGLVTAMQSMATYWAARVNALGHSPANFLNLNNDSSWLYAWRYGKGEKKTECRPLKTSRTWGKMHIPIPKSHFFHRPSAHARNYGKMHGCHPNFQKLTIDFMLRRHYKCAFYTVICRIFITSLLSDLSLRVVHTTGPLFCFLLFPFVFFCFLLFSFVCLFVCLFLVLKGSNPWWEWSSTFTLSPIIMEVENCP